MAFFVCAICSRKSKESIASKYCSGCEEAICEECVGVHGAIKALANHHIIDITLFNNQAFTVNKICTQHSRMILELYCSDHDTLCCRSCMADDHRTCKELVPVDVAAKNIKHSKMVDDISECIEHLNKTADELETQEKRFSATLHESKSVVTKRFNDFKSDLLERIAELERRILSEIDLVYTGLLTKTANNRKQIEDRVKAVKEISSQFDFVVNHGSNGQILYLLHSIKLNIHETGKSTDEFIPSWTSNEIVYKESDLLSCMKTFSYITVTKKIEPCNIQYKRLRNKQAKILQSSCTIKKLELEKIVSIPSTDKLAIPSADKLGIQRTDKLAITCMDVTKDNILILCNWSSNNLIVLGEDGQHMQNITLPGATWGIAVEPDTNEAWITLPLLKYLQIVSTETYTLTRRVNAPCYCYGITMVGNDVALGTSINKVCIINKQGVRLKELRTGIGIVSSLCVRSPDKLYCCANEEKPFCIHLDGTIEYPFSSKELNEPSAIITDAQGNVYIIGQKSNNLHRFSADGKFHEIMLTCSVGLKYPYTLAFNSNYSKMFIPNYYDKTLRVFSCT